MCSFLCWQSGSSRKAHCGFFTFSLGGQAKTFTKELTVGPFPPPEQCFQSRVSKMLQVCVCVCACMWVCLFSLSLCGSYVCPFVNTNSIQPYKLLCIFPHLVLCSLDQPVIFCHTNILCSIFLFFHEHSVLSPSFSFRQTRLQ